MGFFVWIFLFLGIGKTSNELKHSVLLVAKLLEEDTALEWFIAYLTKQIWFQQYQLCNPSFMISLC